MAGSVAVVTGASAGIGRATALAFARAGARVVVADVQREAGEETARLIREGGGSIVNCSSVAGLVGFAGIAAYTASKHGMVGLTRAAALDYAQQGIRVNAVCPGVIRTAMVERFTHGDPQAEAALVAREPMGRMGTPDEIAAAVLWLCSDAASFVTGQALAVDGGFVSQ